MKSNVTAVSMALLAVGVATVGLLAAPSPEAPAAGVTSAASRVPISIIRNKTVVPVRLDGVRELHLIVDSGMGAEGLLLFRPELRDSLGGEFNEGQMAGAGDGAPSKVYFTDGLSFRVGETRFENQRVILLTHGYFAKPGIDGVIGHSLFGRYTVEMDFDALTLALRDPAAFEPPPDWTVVPLTFARQMPFLQISVAIADEPPVALRTYIDCASSEAVELLLQPGQKFTVPQDVTDVVLGQGLSGDIHGQRGRIARLILGPHELRNVMAAFAPAKVRTRQPGAEAVLSNAALRRFNVVYDYAHARLLIKPNGHFREPFE